MLRRIRDRDFEGIWGSTFWGDLGIEMLRGTWDRHFEMMNATGIAMLKGNLRVDILKWFGERDLGGDLGIEISRHHEIQKFRSRNLRISWLWDFEISGFRNFWIYEFGDFMISGIRDFVNSRFRDFGISEIRDFWITGFRISEFRVFGFSDFWHFVISTFRHFWISWFCCFCDYGTWGLRLFRISGLEKITGLERIWGWSFRTKFGFARFGLQRIIVFVQVVPRCNKTIGSRRWLQNFWNRGTLIRRVQFEEIGSFYILFLSRQGLLMFICQLFTLILNLPSTSCKWGAPPVPNTKGKPTEVDVLLSSPFRVMHA